MVHQRRRRYGAGPDLQAFQRSEAQQQLLDAGLALKSHNAKVVGGAGGLAGDDDALAEFRMSDVVAGIKGLEGRSGLFVVEGSVEAGAVSAAMRAVTVAGGHHLALSRPLTLRGENGRNVG